jgi:hypothetical protein
MARIKPAWLLWIVASLGMPAALASQTGVAQEWPRLDKAMGTFTVCPWRSVLSLIHGSRKNVVPGPRIRICVRRWDHSVTVPLAV